jgi:hypothetical protein
MALPTYRWEKYMILEAVTARIRVVKKMSLVLREESISSIYLYPRRFRIQINSIGHARCQSVGETVLLELTVSKQITPRLLGFIGTRNANLKKKGQPGSSPDAVGPRIAASL